MISRSCSNLPIMLPSCTQGASLRRHRLAISTCILVIHIAMACSTRFRRCMVRAARCPAFQAPHLTCAQYHLDAPFTRAVPWLSTHVIRFCHSCNLPPAQGLMGMKEPIFAASLYPVTSMMHVSERSHQLHP